MLNSFSFSGDFYDKNYFEYGQESGKCLLSNYRWMPERSYKEAQAFINYFNLDEKSYVLEVGTAKGFIVKALREHNIKCDGCDISSYALSFAPDGCWNCEDSKTWDEHKDCGYTHIIMKDVLEHLTVDQISKLLNNLSKISNKIMSVIPIGDNGVYRISEYHRDISHIIAEDEEWWNNQFNINGWKVIKHCEHVEGLKDNWQSYANGRGNHVFVLEKKI